MRSLISITILCLSLITIGCQSSSKSKHTSKKGGYHHKSAASAGPIPTPDEPFLTEPHQITFAGKRSGEGYFSSNGDQMIFQSERHKDNPFYQIYMKDIASGKTWRVSPGRGKTTCAWIHPTKNLVLFSSTHQDPKARAKEKEEIKIRQSGKQRRYSWNYDEHYDIFVSNKAGKRLKNLTKVTGYDAEASFSPDGKWIAFASNRLAYSSKMGEVDKKAFKQNQAYMMDIYIMKADGSDVRQLTTHKGYDGGPFFSPNGKKIVWRRFAANGHTAEIFTMNIDGSNKKQLTNSNAMSWAPFYHPSGDYIIYTTSIHGHHNFELYAVDSEGLKKPIRISYSNGFDGLPVFTPDGESVVWSKKLANNQSQIYSAKWNDSLVRKKLNLKTSTYNPQLKELSYKIRKGDIKKLVYHLASKEMRGRNTGSPEEKVYTEELAQLFRDMGLRPYGTKGSFFQEFDFVSQMNLGKHNYLKVSKSAKTPDLLLGKNWTPLSFSKSGSLGSTPVAFVGYGIVAPGDEEMKAYSSYRDIDVNGKWAMMFRYVPEEISLKKRQQLLRYSNIRSKVMAAKMRGAKGVIFISGPNSSVKSQLIKFNPKSISSAGALHAVSLTDELAQNLIGTKRNLKKLQDEYDKGSEKPGFDIHGLLIGSHFTIKRKMGKGRNVLALLKVPGARKTLIIGAHGDHLGAGKSGSSLMNSSDTSNIHYGADDNASGMAGVVELAHYFSKKVADKRHNLKQNILFTIWSGEEIGILGSNHFAKHKSFTNKKRKRKLKGAFSAYINMDMIGRLKNSVAVQGVGSSSDWPTMIEKIAHMNSVPMVTQEDPYLPTDAMALYVGEIPVLSFFTGVHTEYHSPRDRAETLNWDGTYKTVNLVKDFVVDIAAKRYGPKFTHVDQKKNMSSRSRGFRVSLGTIPDYSHTAVKGVLLSGVVKGGSAEKAGVRSGDVIVKLANITIDSIYDYVYSLQSIKPNKKTKIIVLRNGLKTELDIVPQSKE